MRGTTIALVLALWPCSLARAGDGAPDAAAKDSGGETAPASCGAVDRFGCCDGETLWWCADGALKTLHCGARPHCGWSNAGFYDCSTSGSADPAGAHARSCPTLPPSDGALRDRGGGAGCRGVSTEGCCAGEALLYCLDGTLRALHCGLNPKCGWLANAQYYDCGTAGLADPSGVYKKSCPIPAPDGLVFAPFDSGPRDRGAERRADGGDGGSGGDCDCALSARPPAGAGGLLLLALLGATSGRRSARSAARRLGRSPRRR